MNLIKYLKLKIEWHIIIVCTLFLCLTLIPSLNECCSSFKKSSKIRLDSKNGYKNIIIGIHDDVKESPLLIERIKEQFTKASKFLFNITR
jgi:hypothetical protein